MGKAHVNDVLLLKQFNGNVNLLTLDLFKLMKAQFYVEGTVYPS